MKAENLLATSNDYSYYCNIKLNNKLKPVYGFIEQLLLRLEELQVLLDVVKINKTFAGSMTLFLSFKSDFDSLCNKVDRLEALMLHVQSNLDKLEEEIINKETELGFGETSLKVTSIFTPLFKKSDKKGKTYTNSEPLNVKEYFTATE